MRLSSIFLVTFSIGVLTYPAMQIPAGKAFFADSRGKQAEPVPKPRGPRTEFALLTGMDEQLVQTEKDYRIVVNIPATKLILYEDNKPVLEYPVAVGDLRYRTPTGPQEIKEIVWNPWWYPPKSEWAKNEKITPPGPKNPLGPVKMPMSADIRLHGTTKDYSIGQAASHGCIRMHSKDALSLAWYLQSHLTDKSDIKYLEKYKKASKTSFYVKLDKPVSVSIVYEPVAVVNDTITIYPDLYGKVKDIKGIVEWQLYSNGINPWKINLEKVPKDKPKKILNLDITEMM